MNARTYKALVKLATTGNPPKSPGFLDSFNNWTSSLFDGQQGTSMPYFNKMMNSEGMKNFGKSFNAFADNAGKFVNSFSNQTKGSTWDSFKNMYTGAGAPWAWGATALTAATMASAFNNPSSNALGRTSGNTGGGGGFWGALPWLGLGALGLYAYKQWPKWKNTYHELKTLSSGSTEERAKQLREYSKNPEAKRRAEAGVKLLGTQQQLTDFQKFNNVSPVMQQADDTVKNIVMPDSLKRNFTPNSRVVQEVTDPTVYADAQKANNRIVGLGYGYQNNPGYSPKPVNATAQLDSQSLGMDSRNLDSRGVEELTLLMGAKLNREAFNKQYRAIIARNNMRANGKTTNSITGQQIPLTQRKPMGWWDTPNGVPYEHPW